MSEQDRALEAFHRLLADGSAGGQAKVDALVALAQRTVLIPIWSHANNAFRTLVNAEGMTALPVFTSVPLLSAAARRFGWLEADGKVAHREVGSRAALRHAVAQNLPFVVVDIASPHSLEITRAEVAPLLTPQARREGQGPYAGVGRLSSSMLQAVRATPPPGALDRDRIVRPAVPEVSPQARQQQPVGEVVGNAARAQQPAEEPSGDGEPDELRQTGTREKRSTPIAHVLGEERSTPTPQRGHKRPSVRIGGRATRESSRPPNMDDTGAYGAAARTRRREQVGRTPPAGGIRTPFVKREQPSFPLDGSELQAESRAAMPPPVPPRVRQSSGRILRSEIPAVGADSTPPKTSEPSHRITSPIAEPPPALLDAATSVLRDYPEVEWAAFCSAARPGGQGAVIAIRIDESFRERVSEIVLGLRTAASTEGSEVEVLLLDDPDAARSARTEGIVFYPWRRTPSRPGT